MLSQTGYGRGTNSNSLGSATAEVKAVNGRFLDIVVKGKTSQIEEQIKKAVQNHASRGTVEVRVFVEPAANLSQKVNYDVAKAHIRLAKELAKKTSTKQSIGTQELLAVQGVLVEEQMDAQNLWSLVEPALSGALQQFLAFKQKEGEALRVDLLGQAKEIEVCLAKVEECVPAMLKESQQKMRNRIAELLGSVELDETKLANEVAFFVDRVDINEEIKRLKSHLNQFGTLLNQSVAGKQLEFLSQEMTREINTMGSKSNDIEITKCVLQMKNANEKIKEQIRNVE